MSLGSSIEKVLETKVVTYTFFPSNQADLCELTVSLRTLGQPGLCREPCLQQNKTKKVQADNRVTWVKHLVFFLCLAHCS